MRDESYFTPGGPRGYHSWNGWSPEREFVRFAVALVNLIQPMLTIETGAGQGFITQALPGKVLSFEADPDWRNPLMYDKHRRLADEPTPTPEQWASAQVVILDSDPSLRIPEIEAWADHGWGYALIHDAPREPKQSSRKKQISGAIRRLGFHTIWLPNPRGSALLAHPRSAHPGG